ncbi:MAG: 2-hydroxyacyl-CoA dehydratase subunit D [Syntrophomonadaceae bacterium]
MQAIATILREMEGAVKDPGGAVRAFKQETGREVIGCLPIYVPEEIIYAGGMLPIGVWGGQTNIVQSGTYLPSFACSIMRAIMEFAMRGVYNDLSAVVCPMHCDTLKCIGENWKVGISEVPCFCLVYPQNRKNPSGISYLTTEFEHLRKKLESLSGRTITDEAINQAIVIYNEHRKTIREFTRVARDYPLTITAQKRHMVIKSGFFMDKAKHTLLVKSLISELKALPAENSSGIKVILTGIMAEPDSFLELFNQYNLVVVGDDLAHESRQFRTDVPAGGTPLERLARRWAEVQGCSLAYDPEKRRSNMLIDMVRETGADGVIVTMMKFCEPEEFDYPILKKEFEKANIPHLYIELEQQADSAEQLRTRIQGFAEMMSTR